MIRRFNTDPIVKEYESPYLAFGGNPIWFSDVNGDDADCKGCPDPNTKITQTFKYDEYGKKGEERGEDKIVKSKYIQDIPGNRHSTWRVVETILNVDSKGNISNQATVHTMYRGLIPSTSGGFEQQTKETIEKIQLYEVDDDLLKVAKQVSKFKKENDFKSPIQVLAEEKKTMQEIYGTTNSATGFLGTALAVLSYVPKLKQMSKVIAWAGYIGLGLSAGGNAFDIAGRLIETDPEKLEVDSKKQEINLKK